MVDFNSNGTPDLVTTHLTLHYVGVLRNGPLPKRTSTYTYDGLQRLTGVVTTPGSTYGYEFDAGGNRTLTSVSSPGGTGELTPSSYDPADQRQSWTYDAAGNALSDGAGTTFTYDALNRLSSRTVNGVTTNYTYNGDGVLVAETTNSVTTRYTQDLAAPLPQILAVTQGSTTTRYGSTIDGTRLIAVQGSTRTWYGTDALGSVRFLLGRTGAMLDSVSYDAWGQPLGPPIARFGFTGELQQGNLVYLRARWYHAGVGTFTAKDPFDGFAQRPYSLHPYQYGYSNPLRYTDPSGKCVGPAVIVCVIAGILLAGGAALAAPATAYAPPEGQDPAELPPSNSAFPSEADKAFLSNAPGTSDANDIAIATTGHDAFGNPQDGTTRVFAVVVALLPFISVGLVRTFAKFCSPQTVTHLGSAGTRSQELMYEGKVLNQKYLAELMRGGRLFGQEGPGTCVAASCRMALAAFNKYVDEELLRRMLPVHWEKGGNLRDAPNTLNFFLKRMGKHERFAYRIGTVTFEDLQEYELKGPILVGVSRLVPGAGRQHHAVMIQRIDPVTRDVQIYDPEPVGEGSIITVSYEQFMQAWGYRREAVYIRN